LVNIGGVLLDEGSDRDAHSHGVGGDGSVGGMGGEAFCFPFAFLDLISLESLVGLCFVLEGRG